MPLSKIELKTLIILANYGPLSGYDLHSKKSKGGTGAAETVIMSDVHWLSVRKNLIESNLIVELERMGRRKPYKLSVDGFDLILRTHLSEINDIDTFALNYEEYFPLVFSLWGDLKKHGLDDYVKNGVAEIIQRIYVDLFSEFVLKVRGRYSHDEFIENISARIYLPDLYIGGEDDFDIGQTCRNIYRGALCNTNVIEPLAETLSKLAQSRTTAHR